MGLLLLRLQINRTEHAGSMAFIYAVSILTTLYKAVKMIY